MYPVCIPVFCCLGTNMPEVVPFIMLWLLVYSCYSALGTQGARSVQSRELLE